MIINYLSFINEFRFFTLKDGFYDIITKLTKFNFSIRYNRLIDLRYYHPIQVYILYVLLWSIKERQHQYLFYYRIHIEYYQDQKQ
jgi:hypothetical protein